MRAPIGRSAVALALATALTMIGADTDAQTAGSSAMTVGNPGSGGAWGPVPNVGITPPRGSSWGPGGYSSDQVYVPATRAEPVPAQRAYGFYADDVVTTQGRPSDRPVAGREAVDRDVAARGYRRVGPGFVVPDYLRAAPYVVADWRGYGLTRPATGRKWLRYYDDALLIDATGRVQDARYDIDWARDGSTTTYVDAGYYQGDEYDRGFVTEGEVVDDGVQVYRSGADAPNVTVHRNPDGSTTVVVRNEPQVTTTTRYVPAAPLPPPAPTYMARRR